MRVPTTTPHDSGTKQEDDTMSSTNDKNTTETEADTEGHIRAKQSRIGEAGTEADTEGHGRGRTSRIGEAGAEDDDTEGHASRRSGR